MKVFKDYILIISFFFFLLDLLGQDQISFRQLSVKEGLSQNSVVSVTQDSIGFLWVATQNGLNKYDGNKFVNYKFDFVDITRPTYSHLGKVYVDRIGSIFIIPLDKNLYKYDAFQDKFTLIQPTSDVSSIFQDVKGNYWIGTYTNGLQVFDKNFSNKETIVEPEKLSSAVYDIAAVNKELISVSVDKKIITIDITTKTFEVIIPESVLGEKINRNFSITINDLNGKQWIGTFGDGLYYKEDANNVLDRFSDIEFAGLLPNNLNILDLHVDARKRLWIATYGSGLYMIDFELKKISHFTVEKYNPKAIQYNDVLCIYEDYTGTIWFGTDGAGLSYYEESLEKFNSFTNLQTPENINIDVIRALVVDNKQNIWLGTSGKGLTEYEPSTNSWRTFTTLNSDISSNRIMSLFFDDGDLWIGTQGSGLIFYNEKTGFTAVKNLEAKTIWNIFKDSHGSMWLGTQNQGLVKYDKFKGVLKQYKSSKSQLLSDNIRVIIEDDKKNLWIGTDNEGLVKYNMKTENFKTFRAQDGENSLSGNGIKSLYYDHRNVLWIGTNGNGLNALDTKKKKFYYFTEKEGLANNVIYAILPDDKDNLWLSSNKGITHFSMNDSINDPSIKNYNNYAGLATEFNTGAYYKHTNGELYFGGLEGFYWFNPNDIRDNLTVPKTTITNFKVLDEEKPLVNKAALKHNENTLTFTFSSLQFALPEKNQYRYMLLNYDEDWIDAPANSVRYSRLPPGDYQFQVKSSNYDGVWNEVPAVFSLKINAPWYFNFYAKLAYILLFLLTLYGIFKYVNWRWQMKLNLELQEQEAQRLKQLNSYKSKLYVDVAHEFRTPLTLISAPIDSKLTEGNLSDLDYANFSGIKRNTNRLTTLVDQLLQLAKLEKGKQKLKLSKGDLGLFLSAISEPFQYRAKAKEIDFLVEISEIENVWYDEDVIEKIVSNLLSNATKYTSKNGKASAKGIAKNSKLYFQVTNTIRNSSTIEVEKLFDRFYQKDEYTEGVGVGLSLVKELVKLYNGEIKVENEANSITFMVELPIEMELFNLDEVEIIEREQRKSNEMLLSHLDVSGINEVSRKSEKPILLVVEDNEEVRAFITRSLSHKYLIHGAINGQEGVEKALEYIPDIILSDVRMPKKNGIELCNTLKSNECTSHIPIILLTADAGEENELRGLESGADDFIVKPFKLRVLEKRLDNLIEIRKALRERYTQEYVLKPSDISLTSTDEAFLNKLQTIIDSDFSNPDFSAADFCKKISMSRMQLHRKLMAYTGLSTSAFIRSQRLKKAVQILTSSDATINEVAYAVGFNTPSYFIKCFKESYKKTPLEYLQHIDR